MAEHPNAELLRRSYEAFQKRDLEGFLAQMADDITFHEPPGIGSLRDAHGKEEVRAFFGRVAETLGPVEIEVHDVLASDDHVAGLVRLRASVKGKPVESAQIHLWHVRNGKLVELWRHPFDYPTFKAVWEGTY